MSDHRQITGYTMISVAVGVSLVVALPTSGVVQRDLVSFSGGTLALLGVSGAAGIIMNQPTSVPATIPGGGNLYISARGATTTANFICSLSLPNVGATVITG